MSKITDLLIAESEKYLSALLAEKLPVTIIYHDFNHALRIKNYAETIGEQTGLSADEMNILRICALFLDSGYINSFKKHNEESVAIASAFLAERAVDQQTLDQISAIIRATKIPYSPQDKIAEVLCDADMMFIASEDGIEQFDQLYDEAAMSKRSTAKRADFEKGCMALFETHTYFTEYGKTILQPKKESAVSRISERLKRRKLAVNKKKSQELKDLSYSRGVDTMFRITARNQINLNSIADNKSNILISVNAIIISIIITMLAGNIGNMSQDIVPVLVFLVICLATIIIAIMSTRPNLVNKKFTREDLRNKNIDLTYFGNFIKLNYDEYLLAVKEMMEDDDHLYAVLLKNQYELGKILAKKFKLVKTAYNVFMAGIILTVLVFLLNYLFMHLQS